MTEELIDGVITDLPAYLKPSLPPGYRSKQTWGWILRCDVRCRTVHQLVLSGSYGMSGSIAKDMADVLAQALRAQGFKVTIYDSRF